jgi:hypothetical protein
VREFAAASLKAGQGIPLWNPYIMGGLPYVAAMHGDIYYPTFLLRAVLPTDVAMTWSFMLHYPLAGLFTFVFLRSWGLSFIPSLLGGLAYLMCGPIASYVAPGHDGKLYVSTLLPLMLWALTRGVRDGRAWAWGVAVIAVGLAVLSPHPQLLQYFLLVSGAFALWVALGAPAVKLDRPATLRRLGLALGSVVIGMMMGAVQYWPVMEYVKWSPRAAGGSQTGWEHAVSYSFPPEELVNTYLPEFTGILDRYYGRNFIHFHSEYLGAALLVLAFAGLGAWRLRNHSKGFVWFWLGTLVISLLWALGGFTPFYHLVYAIVPGTKFFRAPSTIIYVTAFALCVLAALGTERLLARSVSQRYLVGWAIGAAVVALLALVGALGGMAEGLAESTSKLRAAMVGQPEVWPQFFQQLYGPMVEANAGAIRLGALRSLLFVLLVVGLGLAHLRRMVPRAVVAWGLVLVVGADFYSVLKQYWKFSPPAAHTYGSNPAIDAIKREPQPARVLTMNLKGASTREPMIRGDGLMVHEIRQFEGYHGNELGRFREFADRSDSGQRPNAWSLYNIKFLLTNDSLTVPGLAKILGPVQSAYAGSTGSDEKLYLYRLPGSNPYAWVAPAVLKAPDAQVAATVTDPRFDSTYQRRVALADPEGPLASNANPNALPQPVAIAATVRSYAPGRVSLALDQPAPAGSALVVSENYYPGWTARVDGRPAPVGRVDYTLIGVGLPAGARAVELTFESARSATGKLLTLASLGLAVVVIAAGLVADRRRRVAA